MKTILCYGDSLTWGYAPGTGARHAFADRWPSVLADALGHDNVRVIAEGLSGRTTAFDDHTAYANLNGATVLPAILGSHHPLDCVIIMLGTNDMKSFVCGSAFAAGRGMRRLVEIIRSYPYGEIGSVPEIILVAPPHCVATDHADLGPAFAGASEISRDLAKHYKSIADENNCAFFDTAHVANASKLDGVHMDAKNTRAIGAALAPLVEQLLGLNT